MPVIEHIAIWVNNLEESRKFYCKYFEGTAGDKYHNPRKKFSSYFISFKDQVRLELMHIPGLVSSENKHLGYAHMAFSVGSKKNVELLTEKMRNDGVIIIGEPRTTGDGYYESVICDPDGNPLEITI
jgi:lactoylglutathione lyase